MKQKQRRKKGKKERKTRNKRKQQRKTRRKKERKEQERERERERQRQRNWKRGRPKKAKEKERETLKNKQRMPFSGEKKTGCLSIRSKGKKKKQKKNKEGLGPREVTKKDKRKSKKHKNTPQKIGFQLSVSQNFLFYGGVSKNSPVLTTWPRKRAPKQHYKNRGFSKAFLEKNSYASRNKKHKWRNFSYLLFCLFLLFQQQKHQD